MTSAAPTDAPAVRVVGILPLDMVGARTVLRLAAAAPADSTDPVDAALRESTGKHWAASESFERANPERRYSIAVVRGIHYRSEDHDVEVIRGDLQSVVAACQASRSQRGLLRRNAKEQHSLGRRSLVVAMRPCGSTDPYTLVGLIPLAVGDRVRGRSAPLVLGENTDARARVDLWPAALRIQHWLNLIFIVGLTFTGWYIMSPFFGPSGSEPETGYLMGTIRFAHFVFGFAWILLGIWRVSLFFFAKRQQMQWKTLWPLYSWEDVHWMGRTIQYYLFLRPHGPAYYGHNALQQLAYTGIYGLCIVQMCTGLALYGLADQTNIVWVILSYPVHWIGVPTVRLIHTLLMFVIWAFVIIHVYLVFRSDALHGSGETSAMINGHVTWPRGTQPVNGPEIE